MPRIRLITMSLVLMLFSNSFAEILNIMDVIPRLFKTKNLSRQYALRLDDLIYSSEVVSDFLAITTAVPDSFFVAGKLDIKMNRSETLIFTGENYHTAIKERAFVSLIPGMNGYLVNSPHGDSAYKSEIFSFPGDLVRSFIGPDVDPSPDGRYFYTRFPPEKWQPLIVYDSEMNQKLKFPFEGRYLVNALPGGIFAAGEKDRIYLYDAAGDVIMWDLELPKRSYVVDEAFNIRFSPAGDIIIARDKTQVHFIDKNGRLLWSNNRITAGYTIGVSHDGSRALFAVGSHTHLIFQLYDMTGNVILERDNNIAPGLAGADVWDNDVYVSSRFLMARFKAKDKETGEDRFITGICINDDGKHVLYAVDGLWFYLGKSEAAGTLVGYDNAKKEIVAYPVVLK